MIGLCAWGLFGIALGLAGWFIVDAITGYSPPVRALFSQPEPADGEITWRLGE